MKKIIMLCFFTPLCFAMGYEEIKFLLDANKSYDEIALATFEPSHEKLNCFQSSLIKGIRYGYNTIPLATLLLIGPVAYTFTGDLKSLCVGIPFLVGLTAYPWDLHTYNSVIYTNKVASKYLPKDYAQHKIACLDAIRIFQEEQQQKIESKKHKQKKIF